MTTASVTISRRHPAARAGRLLIRFGSALEQFGHRLAVQPPDSAAQQRMQLALERDRAARERRVLMELRIR